MQKNQTAISHGVEPQLKDYTGFYASFDWATEKKCLSGLPGANGLNIAYEAVERHSRGKLKDTIALRWIARDKTIRNYTYDELNRLSSRFADLLSTLDIKKGERVFTLTGRIPELYIAALGTLKTTAVFCPIVFCLWTRAYISAVVQG